MCSQLLLLSYSLLSIVSYYIVIFTWNASLGSSPHIYVYGWKCTHVYKHILVYPPGVFTHDFSNFSLSVTSSKLLMWNSRRDIGSPM